METIKKSTKENIEHNEKVQKIVNNVLEKMCDDAMTHTKQKNKIASNHDCSFPSDDVLDTENITIVSGERREEVNIVDTHNGVCGLYFSSNAQVEDIWIAYLTKHPHIWGWGYSRIGAMHKLEEAITNEETIREQKA